MIPIDSLNHCNIGRFHFMALVVIHNIFSNSISIFMYIVYLFIVSYHSFDVRKLFISFKYLLFPLIIVKNKEKLHQRNLFNYINCFFIIINFKQSVLY